MQYKRVFIAQLISIRTTVISYNTDVNVKQEASIVWLVVYRSADQNVPDSNFSLES